MLAMHHNIFTGKMSTYHACIRASSRLAAHRRAAQRLGARQRPTVVGNAKLFEDVAAWRGQGGIHVRFWGS